MQPGNGHFAHRTNRVIATVRVVLALLLSVWIWLDPEQPARTSIAGLELFIGYAVWSLCLLAIAWTDWWLDFQFSAPSFLLDCLVFLIAMAATEGTQSDFFSPFFALFAFIVQSAVLRWNWTVAVFCTLALCTCIFLIAGTLQYGGVALDDVRLLRRTTYMVLISGMIIWLVVRRAEIILDRTGLAEGGTLDCTQENILDWAIIRASATGGALVWRNNDEPRGHLVTVGSLGT